MFRKSFRTRNTFRNLIESPPCADKNPVELWQVSNASVRVIPSPESPLLVATFRWRGEERPQILPSLTSSTPQRHLLPCYDLKCAPAGPGEFQKGKTDISLRYRVTERLVSLCFVHIKVRSLLLISFFLSIDSPHCFSNKLPCS